MISAIARPSSEPLGLSASTWTLAGRSPVACEPTTPPPTALIESDITPTFTPAPLTPRARAAGPLWAASPADVTEPTSVPSTASVPVAVIAEIPWVTSRLAAASARPTGR